MDKPFMHFFILQALAALWRPLRRGRATDGVSLPFFRQRAHKGFAIVTGKEDELWRGAAPPCDKKISFFCERALANPALYEYNIAIAKRHSA